MIYAATYRARFKNSEKYQVYIELVLVTILAASSQPHLVGPICRSHETAAARECVCTMTNLLENGTRG